MARGQKGERVVYNCSNEWNRLLIYMLFYFCNTWTGGEGGGGGGGQNGSSLGFSSEAQKPFSQSSPNFVTIFEN